MSSLIIKTKNVFHGSNKVSSAEFLGLWHDSLLNGFVKVAVGVCQTMGGIFYGLRMAGASSTRAISEAAVEEDISPSLLSDDILSPCSSRVTLTPVTWSELQESDGVWTAQAKDKVSHRQMELQWIQGA